MSIELLAELDDEITAETDKLREELTDLVTKYAEKNVPPIVIAVEFVSASIMIAGADPTNRGNAFRSIQGLVSALEEAVVARQADMDEADKDLH